MHKNITNEVFMTVTTSIDDVPKSWPKFTLNADQVWDEVEDALEDADIDLPKTPRCPDIRMILDNKTGQDLKFMNPGNHADNERECIPGKGDSTAAMVMLQGETLEEQYNNAQELYEMFNLGEEGLSPAFLAAMEEGTISHLVKEVYGKTNFEAQADRLIDLDWLDENNQVENVKPQVGKAAAFGARPPESELVFEAEVPFYVQGTNTVPELAENDGMFIAVSKDWKTGEETTRPIVPSVAQHFYGAHYHEIPEVIVHNSGHVMSIQLDDGKVINLPPPKGLNDA